MGDLIEYLLFFPAGSPGTYEVRVHLTDSPRPDCLAHRRADLEKILELLCLLERQGPMMRFDDYLGRVGKIELDPQKRELVLRVKLETTAATS